MNAHEARVTTVVAAPPDRVWTAWTDPQVLRRWYCPNPDMALEVEADVVVGGAYRVDMGGGTYVAEGTYTVLEPPHLLEFTWRWTTSDGPPTQVRVELTPTDDGGTHVLLVQRGLADAQDAAGHVEGWELSLGRLADLEGASSAPGAPTRTDHP